MLGLGGGEPGTHRVGGIVGGARGWGVGELPPTLRQPGDPVPANQPNKVRFPDDPDAKTKVQPIPPPPSQSTPQPPSPSTPPGPPNDNLRASAPAPGDLNPQE